MAGFEDLATATQKPKLTVYVNKPIDQVLDQVATSERRSKSQMAAILIEEALKARGFDVSADQSAD